MPWPLAKKKKKKKKVPGLITDVFRSRREMEEKGKRGLSLLISVSQGKSPRQNECQVSAVFTMLGHYLFWPCSSVCSSSVNKCASFPQQWVPLCPSPSEQVECHGVSRDRLTIVPN